MDEKDGNSLYGYIFVMKVAQFFLKATSWLFGYSIARAYMDASPALETATAALAGLIVATGIDGGLGLLVKDLLHDEKPRPYKWAFAVAFTLLTASTTLVGGYFVGQAKAGALGRAEKEEILAQSAEAHSGQLSSLSNDLASIEGRIAALESQFRADTAQLIANMTENHRSLYRRGQHEKYMRSAPALRENVGRIEALATQLAQESASLKGRRYTLSQARDRLAASSPESAGAGKVAAIEADNARMGAIVSGSVYIMDFVSVALLWAIFILIREKIAAGAKIDVEVSSFTRWLLDRAAILQNKVLDAFSGADDEIADAARFFLSIPVSVIKLLAWLAGIVSQVFLLPTRLYKPLPLTRRRKTSPAPDMMPPAGPVPVRDGGGLDAWEMLRRQQLAEARLDEMQRQAAEDAARRRAEDAERERRAADRIRQLEAERAQLAQQKEEESRQLRQRADKLSEKLSELSEGLSGELSEMAKKVAAAEAAAEAASRQLEAAKPLSDNGSSHIEAKVVGDTVKFDGKTYNLSELSVFADNAAKWYARQFASKTPQGRADNAARWLAAKPILEKLGYEISRREGNRVSITGGRDIKA